MIVQNLVNIGDMLKSNTAAQ